MILWVAFVFFFSGFFSQGFSLRGFLSMLFSLRVFFFFFAMAQHNSRALHHFLS